MVSWSHLSAVFLVAVITVGDPAPAAAGRDKEVARERKSGIGKLIDAGRRFVTRPLRWTGREKKGVAGDESLKVNEAANTRSGMTNDRRAVVASPPSPNGLRGKSVDEAKKLDVRKLLNAGRDFFARHLWWPGRGEKGVAGDEQLDVNGARNRGQRVDNRGRPVDARGRLVDARGRLVDDRGRLVDDMGRLVDARGRLVDNMGRLVDARGRPVDARGRGGVNTGRGAVQGHPPQNGQRTKPAAKKLDWGKLVARGRNFLARNFTIGGWRIERISAGIAGVVAFPAWSDQTKKAAGELGKVLDRMLKKTTSIRGAPADGVQPGDVDWTMYELRGSGGRLVGRVGIGHSTVRTPSFGTYMTDNTVQYYVADTAKGARYLLDDSTFRRTPEARPRPAVQVVSCLRSTRGGYRVNVVGDLTHGSHVNNEVEHYAVADMAGNAKQADRMLTSEGISEMFQRAQARKEGRRTRYR
jgi:hypothetical protein